MFSIPERISFQPNIENQHQGQSKAAFGGITVKKCGVPFFHHLLSFCLTHTPERLKIQTKKKKKQTKNNLSLCAARQLWKQKLKTGILFRPRRELLERTAIKFDAERAVLNQKLPSKQLVSLMTTLDSERSLTQLIVLCNFQDNVYVPADILPPFQLKDELDWWPRFSLIESTAGWSEGQREKKKRKKGSYYSIARRKWWELMARVSWSPVVNGSSTRPHSTRSIEQHTDNADM